MAKIDWKKVKMYYLHNNIPLREVAERFDVGEASVFRHSAKENWSEEKKSFDREVIEKARERAVEKQAKSLAEYEGMLRQGIAEGGQLLLGKIMETLNYGEAFSPRDLKNLSSMMNDLFQELKDLKEDAGRGENVQVIEWVNNEWDEA